MSRCTEPCQERSIKASRAIKIAELEEKMEIENHQLSASGWDPVSFGITGWVGPSHLLTYMTYKKWTYKKWIRETTTNAPLQQKVHHMYQQDSEVPELIRKPFAI